MSFNNGYRFNPRKLYLYPLLLGLILMGFCVLVWYYPRVLLFLILFPVFMAGLGLVFYGLDIWRGLPNWRERVSHVKIRLWPGDENRF